MENDKKKPIYQKAWFWLLVIVILGVIIGTRNSNNTSIQTASSTNVSVLKNEKTEYNIGEEAVLGQGAIIVTNVEKSQGSQWEKPKSGKEFVIVHVTIENKGNSNLSYNPFYFKMQNSQGQQESMTFTTIDQDTSLQSGELIPGGKVSGTITFEQPKNDSELILIYNDSIWSSKE